MTYTHLTQIWEKVPTEERSDRKRVFQGKVFSTLHAGKLYKFSSLEKKPGYICINVGIFPWVCFYKSSQTYYCLSKLALQEVLMVC